MASAATAGEEEARRASHRQSLSGNNGYAYAAAAVAVGPTSPSHDTHHAPSGQREERPWKRSRPNQYTLKANQEGLSKAHDALEAARKRKQQEEVALEEARKRYEQLKKGECVPLQAPNETLVQADLMETGQWAGQWNKMYEKMKEYKELHGDCLVPMNVLDKKASEVDPAARKLARWVKHQREYYAKFHMGDNRLINSRRIALLEEIGFVWNQNAFLWRENFNELKAYEAQHGDCCVPKIYEQNPALRKWVEKQIYEMKKRLKDKPNGLTEERIAELDNIGFDWNYTSRKRKKIERGAERNRSINDNWNAMYAKLSAFRERHGHTEICKGDLQRYNNSLSAWCTWQRKQYRALIEGKPSTMTQERVKLLEDLGLKLNERSAPLEAARVALLEAEKACKEADEDISRAFQSVKEAELKAPCQWNTMYETLVQYKATHGDCLVPMTVLAEKATDANSDLRKLARWVKHQRAYCKDYQCGEDTNLINSRRIEALEEIGFVWNTIEHKWNQKMAALADFKNQHGHCNVQDNYEPCPTLASWVTTQRREYDKLQKGKPSAMTPDRVERLNNIGFDWGPPLLPRDCKKAKRQTPAEEWQAMYLKLEEFREKHGHCEMANKTSGRKPTVLARWCAWQRRQYGYMMNGEPSQMTPERARLLEDLGFKWKKQRPKSSLLLTTRNI